MSLSTVYQILGLFALFAVAGLGILLAALQMPGTWLILGGAIVYDWLCDWQCMGPAVLGVLAGLALLGEIVELVASAVLAGKAGGARRASWGGVIGGIVGMFIFSLPVPVIGTIVGGIVGCFVGALIGEMTVRNDLDHSTRVGVGAAVGRIGGMLAKLIIAFVLAGVALSEAIFRLR